jgi:[CysO sulfur-carrier protein]-S-L-cysteine hydrolase
VQQECSADQRARDGQAAIGAPGLPAGILTEVVRQAEAGYPEEVCGIIIGHPEAPETYRVRRVTNIANREPQEDPGGVPRDARTAYKMDPLEQLRVLREVDQCGWEVVAFYHSHPDHDAYFSHMDRERAVGPDGEPIWPGAAYLVVSVMGGRARGAASYCWDPRERGFVDTPVTLPNAHP